MMKRKLLLGASLFFLAVGAQAQKLQDAQKAIEQEQFAKAKGILKTLIQKQPKKGINNFYLGNVYLQNDQIDSAKVAFEEGLAKDPKTLLNQVGLATLDLYAGNTAAAETKFTEILGKTKRKDYLELYFTARAYLDAENPDYGKALNYLRQAVQRSGKKVDPLVYLAMGDAYLGAGDASAAYVAYRDAVTLNPDLTKAEIQMAVIIRNSRAWSEAIEELEKVMQARPDYAPTYRELAETYNRWAIVSATDTATYRDRNRTAVKYYKQYMDLTDYSVESRIRYADFLVFAGDYDELLIQARELSELEDVNPKVLRYLGHSTYNKGDYAATVDAMAKLFTRMDADRVLPLDHWYYGLSLIRTSDNGANVATFDQGLAELKKAVELEKDHADNINEIGLEFFTQRKFAEAAKLFEISSNVEGSRNQVTDTYYFALSSYYTNALKLNAGEPVDEALIQKADKALLFVNEKAPDLLEPYLFRARNMSLLENSEEPQGVANELFFKYIEVVKSKGAEEVQKNKASLIEVYNKLAYFYVQTEQLDQAKIYLEETLLLDAEDAYAKQVLDYINQVNAAAGR